jgi:hypothetical protein
LAGCFSHSAEHWLTDIGSNAELFDEGSPVEIGGDYDGAAVPVASIQNVEPDAHGSRCPGRFPKVVDKKDVSLNEAIHELGQGELATRVPGLAVELTGCHGPDAFAVLE